MPSILNLVIAIDPYNVQSGQYLVKLSYENNVVEEQIQIDRNTLLLHEHQFDACSYGMELYKAVFTEEVDNAYQRLVGRAETEAFVRIQLQISGYAPELHALPWERLFHVFGAVPTPLAASAQTPFSRFLITGAADPPPVVERPLRLLVAIANPTNLRKYKLKPLDVVGEVKALADLLVGLRGQVVGTLIPGITRLPDSLKDRLEQEKWRIVDGVTSWETIQRQIQQMPNQHMLHILAHGQCTKSKTCLLLEHEGDAKVTRGALVRVEDHVIVAGLAGVSPRPHLVFLSACDTAKRSESDAKPFVGLGPKLVQAGVPAVVAMQGEVSMDLAHTLTTDFYRRLFEHGLVDRALNEARSLVYKHDQFTWAIPVLFLRRRDGYLFTKELVSGLVDVGPPPKSEQLRQVLQSLNYSQQCAIFNRFLTKTSCGAFIISGPYRSGQAWLLKRLVNRLANRAGECLVIRMNPEQTAQSISAQVFWDLVANEIGMPIDSSKQALVQKLGDIWRLKHIFFVLTDVTNYLREIDEFWQDLTQKIGKYSCTKKWLILFLINETEPLPLQVAIHTAVTYSKEWSPQEIVRLPELPTGFDESDLFGWLLDHKGDQVLSEIHSQIENDISGLVEEIWEESEKGIPMDTLRAFYDRCIIPPKKRWGQVKKEWTTL